MGKNNTNQPDKSEKKNVKRTLVMSHTLITSPQNSNVFEMHLLRLASYNSQEDETGFSEANPVVVFAEDYVDTFKADEKSIYKQLKDSVEKLYEASFNQRYINKRGKLVIKRTRWVTMVKYIEDEGRIELVFNPQMKEHLWRLSKITRLYGRLDLDSYHALNTSYATRLYEILSKWKTAKVCTYTVEDLRFALAVPKDERSTDFSYRILKPSIELIDGNSDINVTFEANKKGRNIVSYTFFVEEKLSKLKNKKPPQKTILSYEHFCEKYKQDYESLEFAMNRLQESYRLYKSRQI
jgi:plasmid replication initiation protein